MSPIEPRNTFKSIFVAKTLVYQKVLNTISSLIETQHTVDQLSGLDLIGNVAQEQVEEFSEKQEKAREDAFEKYIPWVIAGVGAYFILPRIVTSYVRK